MSISIGGCAEASNTLLRLNFHFEMSCDCTLADGRTSLPKVDSLVIEEVVHVMSSRINSTTIQDDSTNAGQNAQSRTDPKLITI